jgi:hypothetical protein
MTRDGKHRATRDHVFPKSRGYQLRDLNGMNKAIVCAECNTSKKDHDILTWWWRLNKGNDARAPIVLGFIEGLWLSGHMPMCGGKYFEAAISKIRVGNGQIADPKR